MSNMEISLPKTLPAKVWLGFDWSQAELYMLTLFSKDKVLKEALYSSDVHRYVISRLYNISMDEVTSQQRNLSKIISYGLIYSGFDMDSTRDIVLRKSGNTLDLESIDLALNRYKEEFHVLFEWVNQALLDWFNHSGEVRYLLGARKVIKPSDYQKPDLESLRRSKEGRVAINTYGQNSIGLLLKWAYSQIYKDQFLRTNTTQHIPIFDSMSMLVVIEHLAEVQSRLLNIVTPIIRFDGFEIQMKAEWKLGVQSWGQMKTLDLLSSRSENPLVVEWDIPNREELTLPPLNASVDVNPFVS